MKDLFIVFILICGVCLNSQAITPLNSMPSKTTIGKPDSVIIHNHYYTELSYIYDFSVTFKRYPNPRYLDSCVIQVKIISKANNKIIDSLSVSSIFFYDSVFLTRDDVRSFITGYNEKNEVLDNNYGNLIIADLNFDSKEDIVVVNDCVEGGGPYYNYYIQNTNGKFVLDKYLTKRMIFFPSIIDVPKRTLITYVHAGVCCLGEHTYILDEIGSWDEIDTVFIDVGAENEKIEKAEREKENAGK